MKEIVKVKVEGQNQVLRKYGLRQNGFVNDKVDAIKCDSLVIARRKLMRIEGMCSTHYFNEIFQLLPFKPENRKRFKAFDGINNVFNLAYEVLSWKVYRALTHAKLEPYLGFLHSLKFGVPSLVCDFQELYRYLIDDFIIQYCRKLRKKDFILKTEYASNNRKGKREHLNDSLTKDFVEKLNKYFLTIIEIPRIMRGEKQEIETLINEEALLFAKFLRNERQTWKPRILKLSVMEQEKLARA